MTVYSCVYTLLYMYGWAYNDPARVIYIYDSPVGHLIIAMRLLGWLWFCQATRHTLVKYPEKRTFYTRYTMFYTVWFWAAPVSILIGNYLLDNWVREKTANGIENTVAFCGFAYFLWLTRPSAANTNFPYHVRTGQIAVINDVVNMKRGSAIATDLPHHIYQVVSGTLL